LDKYDLLVIGGVAAGTKAAAKARRERLDWRIGIITEEEDISYAGCGLPYYLGGVIHSRGELIIKKPEDISREKDLDVITNHRVLSMDPERHVLSVQNMLDKEIREVRYGKLVIATGANPLKPPIPGIELKNIHTLRKVTDADKIKTHMCTPEMNNILIIGGGVIGIETAENFHKQGKNVTVVELLPQLLPAFDLEIAKYIERDMAMRGIKIFTGTRVEAFEGNGGKVTKVITGKGMIETDMVLLSIGVAPNVAIAASAGAELGVKGALNVDKTGRTNLPDVLAAGDCVSTKDLITGKPVWAPMGSTANKQGRVVGVVSTGGNDIFPGVLGTMIIKVFDMSAGKTGLNEREAIDEGFDAVSCIVPADDRAHYYPGSEKIMIKLTAERESHRLLGAQVYGEGDVDKPIDAMVAAITLGAKVEDVMKMDFAYAPPFSTAVNPLNVASTVLMNKISGVLESVNPQQLQSRIGNPDWKGVILDIGEIPEHTICTIPEAKNIPILEIKDRQDELEKYRNEEIIVLCHIGKRAYEAYLRLRKLGFLKVKVLEGGLQSWPYETE